MIWSLFQFFNHVLILGKEERSLGIAAKVYDLIYELNHICPSVLLAVLPQLECKLKSAQEAERLGAVSLLARMFSEKDSSLARAHHQLWKAFLGRSVMPFYSHSCFGMCNCNTCLSLRKSYNFFCFVFPGSMT